MQAERDRKFNMDSSANYDRHSVKSGRFGDKSGLSDEYRDDRSRSSYQDNRSSSFKKSETYQGRRNSRYSNISSVTQDHYDGEGMLQAMSNQPKFVLYNRNTSYSDVSYKGGRSDTVTDDSCNFDSRWLNQVNDDKFNLSKGRLIPMRNDSASRMSEASAMSSNTAQYLD